MSANREKLGYTEGIVSVITNIFLFVLKYWAGIVSGSIALIADAWHTLSDSLSSIIVIISVKLASRKPDKNHPFGHGRWEQIASIFIAFLLALIAYDFLKESIIRFQEGESANFGTIAIVVTIISIIVKEGLAQYAFWIGKKIDNPSIKADGWHHRTDALSSVIVLAGIFLRKYFWWIDSLLGIIISLMLFYAVFEITREAINKLLGEIPSDELIKKIRSIINRILPGGAESHHFHIHTYGVHRELTFHIRLEKSMDILKAHGIATEIEKAINRELNIEATIHIEPADAEHE
jgi:cation diffusion facilitator family transporter